MTIDALLAGFAALAFSALVIYALTSDTRVKERRGEEPVKKEGR